MRNIPLTQGPFYYRRYTLNNVPDLPSKRLKEMDDPLAEGESAWDKTGVFQLSSATTLGKIPSDLPPGGQVCFTTAIVMAAHCYALGELYKATRG
jgi:hypothetical protein